MIGIGISIGYCTFVASILKMALTFFRILVIFVWLSPAFAQTPVTLQMHQSLNGLPFTHHTTTEADWGYYFDVTRLQYYVSQITLLHDGGQRTVIPDLYFLIDPSVDSIFHLGAFSLTDVEGIEFGIGVDSATNHLDPALYPENHPLALKNPSMHWGWAGGYRFIAFEGNAGQSSGLLPSRYEIHTIGDENYNKVSLPVQEIVSGDSIIIPIMADYTELLHKIDVSLGTTSHSSVGKSRQIALNAERVFSTEVLSATSSIPGESKISIFPNPAGDQFSIQIPGHIGLPLQMTITDMQGKMLQREWVNASSQIIKTETLIPGMYIVSLIRDGSVKAAGMVIIK